MGNSRYTPEVIKRWIVVEVQVRGGGDLVRTTSSKGLARRCKDGKCLRWESELVAAIYGKREMNGKEVRMWRCMEVGSDSIAFLVIDLANAGIVPPIPLSRFRGRNKLYSLDNFAYVSQSITLRQYHLNGMQQF